MAGKKILIVDDEEEILQLLEIELSSEGYEVVTAMDGDEAVQKARKVLPDLILMDILMPTVSGPEAVKQLKSDSLTKKIPVIFLTAILTKEEENETQLGVEVDLSRYPAISKPFDPQELLRKVRQFIAA